MASPSAVAKRQARELQEILERLDRIEAMLAEALQNQAADETARRPRKTKQAGEAQA